MTLRVVLYAEGAGETGGVSTLLPAPGDGLREEHLGPAHVLVRRCLAAGPAIENRLVRFDSPLRSLGRIARGSDLLQRKTLRQLLTWPASVRRPDLVVVLVDRDGDRSRKGTLSGFLDTAPPIKVIAVAVEEFEAWLLADLDTVRKVLGSRPPLSGSPESLSPGDAKALLSGALQSAVSKLGMNEKALRRRIAEECDLDLLSSVCSAFQELRADLKLIPR